MYRVASSVAFIIWYYECMFFRYIATRYHMLNATEVAAGLYTVYACIHTCMCVYMYVIFTSKFAHLTKST